MVLGEGAMLKAAALKARSLNVLHPCSAHRTLCLALRDLGTQLGNQGVRRIECPFEHCHLDRQDGPDGTCLDRGLCMEVGLLDRRLFNVVQRPLRVVVLRLKEGVGVPAVVHARDL